MYSIDGIKEELRCKKEDIRRRRVGKEERTLKEICGIYIYNNRERIEINRENSNEDVREYIGRIGKCMMCENITDEKLCREHRKRSVINLF